MCVCLEPGGTNQANAAASAGALLSVFLCLLGCRGAPITNAGIAHESALERADCRAAFFNIRKETVSKLNPKVPNNPTSYLAPNIGNPPSNAESLPCSGWRWAWQTTEQQNLPHKGWSPSVALKNAMKMMPSPSTPRREMRMRTEITEAQRVSSVARRRRRQEGCSLAVAVGRSVAWPPPPSLLSYPSLRNR